MERKRWKRRYLYQYGTTVDYRGGGLRHLLSRLQRNAELPPSWLSTNDPLDGPVSQWLMKWPRNPELRWPQQLCLIVDFPCIFRSAVRLETQHCGPTSSFQLCRLCLQTRSLQLDGSARICDFSSVGSNRQHSPPLWHPLYVNSSICLLNFVHHLHSICTLPQGFI